MHSILSIYRTMLLLGALVIAQAATAQRHDPRYDVQQNVPRPQLTWPLRPPCELSAQVTGSAVPGAIKWQIEIANEYGTDACDVQLTYPAQHTRRENVLNPSYHEPYDPTDFGPDLAALSALASDNVRCAQTRDDAGFRDRPSYFTCRANLATGARTTVTVFTAGLRAPPARYCLLAGVGTFHPEPAQYLALEDSYINNVGAGCADVYLSAETLSDVVLEPLAPHPTYVEGQIVVEVIGGDYRATPTADVEREFVLPVGSRYTYALGAGWGCEHMPDVTRVLCRRQSVTHGIFPLLQIFAEMQ